MAKVILDAEVFKALASPTRLAVLRALDERRKTVTELARDLDLNKATVHEHLQLLVATGLIRKRDDEGRKWIYYELTWNGERLLHPQETTSFMVMLGISVAAAGGGVALLGRSLDLWWQDRQFRQPDERDLPGPAGDEPVGIAADDTATNGYADAATTPPTTTSSASGPGAASTETGTQTTSQGQTGTQSQTSTQTTSQGQTGTQSQTSTQSATQSQTTAEDATQGGGAGAPPPADPPWLGIADAESSGSTSALEMSSSEAGRTAQDSGTAGLLDEDGWLAIGLLVTSLVLAMAAFIMRRAGWSRQDPFADAAPQEPAEEADGPSAPGQEQADDETAGRR